MAPVHAVGLTYVQVARFLLSSSPFEKRLHEAQQQLFHVGISERDSLAFSVNESPPFRSNAQCNHFLLNQYAPLLDQQCDVYIRYHREHLFKLRDKFRAICGNKCVASSAHATIPVVTVQFSEFIQVVRLV